MRLFELLFTASIGLSFSILAPANAIAQIKDNTTVAVVDEKEFKFFDHPCGTKNAEDRKFTEEELLCIGEPYAEAIKRLQTKDPVADAKATLASGQASFIQIVGGWTGPSQPGIVCLIQPPEDLILQTAFYSDVIGGHGDIVWREVFGWYAEQYNRAMVGHPEFPYSDLCQSDDTNMAYGGSQRFLPFSEWRADNIPSRPPRSLVEAARLGRYPDLQQFLQNGGDPNAADLWDMVPLSWAALRGDFRAAEALLAAGADPNLPESNRPTPLNLALIGGDTDTVALLLNSGARPDKKSNGLRRSGAEDVSSGRGTPIAVATELGRVDLMKQVLEWDGNPDRLGAAAMIAVTQDSPEQLSLLLDYGADPDAHRTEYSQQYEKLSLVQVAAARKSAPMLRMLVPRVGNGEPRSTREKQAWNAALKSSDEILLRLVSAGFSLHRLSQPEFDRLMQAIAKANLEDVDGLIRRSHEIDAKLYAAIQSGDLAETRRLIEGGSGLLTGHGESELIAAIFARQGAIVDWLLSAGADPDILSHPMDLDNNVQLRRPSIYVETLLKNDPETNGSMLAFDIGDSGIIRSVMQASAGGYTNTRRGRYSPLNNALFGFRRLGNAEAIELALQFGGYPEKSGPESDQFLRELCFWTLRSGTHVLASYLDQGYRPRQIGEPETVPKFPGDSLAFNECLNGGYAAAKLLLDHGADPNQPDSIGQVPIAEAISRLNWEDNDTMLLSLLLDAGADPNARMTESMSLIAYCKARLNSKLRDERKQLFRDAIELLERFGATQG